jgi:hypothetical protein
MDMTKFEDVDDAGFMAIAGELRRWVKVLAQVESSTRLKMRTDGVERRSVSQEAESRAPGQKVTNINQGGSVFNGPTTVSGGSLMQGNYVGRDGGFC